MFKKSFLKEVKENLLNMKQQILNAGYLTSYKDIQLNNDELKEDGDIASSVVEQQVSFTMRNKELEKLRKIEIALERLENGSFGVCEECEDSINERRLKSQPWTNLCIEHAEEAERSNSHTYRKRA